MYLAAQLRILCIDDHQDKLKVMGSILRRAGHQVHLALGTERGLRLLQELPSLDVLLINHRLSAPPTTGPTEMDVVTFLATHRRYDSVGVVFHSPLDESDLPVEHQQWQRVDVCLSLPFEPVELLDAVFTAYMLRRGFQHRVTYTVS